MGCFGSKRLDKDWIHLDQYGSDNCLLNFLFQFYVLHVFLFIKIDINKVVMRNDCLYYVFLCNQNSKVELEQLPNIGSDSTNVKTVTMILFIFFVVLIVQRLK